MNNFLELISNSEMESLKANSYTLVYYFEGFIYYENQESKTFKISNKKSSIYLVLTRGGNLGVTQNLNHYSKEVKTSEIFCQFGVDDEVNYEKNSYYFTHDLPEHLIARRKTTFNDKTTEVLLFREQEIKNYLMQE